MSAAPPQVSTDIVKVLQKHLKIGGHDAWEGHYYFVDGIDAAAKELAGVLGAAQAAPEGWKLVPLIPDESMIEVGCENNSTQWNEGTDLGFAADVANDVYVSMVRAAPSPVPSTEGT